MGLQVRNLGTHHPVPTPPSTLSHHYLPTDSLQHLAFWENAIRPVSSRKCADRMAAMRWTKEVDQRDGPAMEIVIPKKFAETLSSIITVQYTE